MAYKNMLDSAFSAYYARFRKLKATSRENAASLDQLFPEGESLIDRKQMHKLLSMEIVKRDGSDRYWLDEKRAADGKGVLLQRLLIIVIAVILGVTIAVLRKLGILNF